MSELCKHQIKDKEKSDWRSTVFRNCKLEAKRDGYCDLHHPENIALAVERAAQSELIEDLRVTQRREESMVGAYMRLRRKEEFDAIIAEVESAEELASKMRGRSR